jgi:hypothetical protein
LDADDKWKTNFLESIINLHHQFPDCGLLATYFERYSKGKKRNQTLYPFYSNNWSGVIKNYFHLMCFESPFNSSSVAIKKDLLIRVGGFPEGVQNYEDLVTWIRLFAITKFGFINAPLSINFHNHENSLSGLYKHTGRILPATVLQEMLKNDQISTEMQKYAKDLISKFQYEEAKFLLNRGNKKEALIILFSSEKAKLFWNKWVKLFIRILTPVMIYEFFSNVKKFIIKKMK